MNSFDKNEWNDIKRGVENICKNYSESYWKILDQKRSYPTDFVNALTKSGYLSILVPEESPRISDPRWDC